VSIALIFVTFTYKQQHAFSIEEPQVDVVLDAGHGGFDGGAKGARGTIEKDLNLAITLKIRDKLAADGVNVGLTRDSDIALGDTKRKDMYWRRDFTIASKPKIFVSIHQNTYTDSKYRGAQVFFSKNNPESEVMATQVQNALKEVNSENTRVATKADNSVFLMKSLDMPAILVECGFISNSDEEWLLTQGDYQEKLAEAIKEGIEGELGRIRTMPTPSMAPNTATPKGMVNE